MSISVLILTFNESINIEACIKAIPWCDDIVVLDSFSQDDTIQKAKQSNARIYQRAFDDFAGQRNFALENIKFKHSWILHLDADEIATSQLQAEIMNAINQYPYEAYRIPSKMMFFGQWLKYSGMYPTYQVRLSKLGRFRFKQVGHGQREDIEESAVGTLTQPYLHYSFSKGLVDWFEKHNRYSNDEAVECLKLMESPIQLTTLFTAKNKTKRRRILKEIAYRLPFRPTLRFIYMYCFKRGFMDGKAGLTYCRLLSIYEYMIVLKTKEILDK